MTADLGNLLRAVVVGAGATGLMDLWNLALKRLFGIPSLDFRLLGRWVLHMPEGRFRHASIAAAERKPHECAIGWMAHYATGVLFAVAFVFVFASGEWLARPTPVPAVLYGIVTVVFPLGVLQPALGLGLASSRVPRPALARIKSLGTHLVFGLGLYVVAWGLSLLARAA